MPSFLKALSVSQVIIFIFATALPFLINALVKDPELNKAISGVLEPIMAVLLVLFRKPASEGGSAKTSGLNK